MAHTVIVIASPSSIAIRRADYCDRGRPATEPLSGLVNVLTLISRLRDSNNKTECRITLLLAMNWPWERHSYSKQRKISDFSC